MNVLQYNDLDVSKVRAAFDRTMKALIAGDFRAADVKKLKGTPFYRAKLSDSDRLLFRFGSCDGSSYLLILEVIRAHAYEKSRFLNGTQIDENKLEPIASPDVVSDKEHLPLPYVNPKHGHFHVLDKIISFDDRQIEAFGLSTPLILIGAAGSGKTVLTIEKLKCLQGDILYVTLSGYLAENARNLYYAHGYENERQNVDFLSLREYIETIHVPSGHPVTFGAFAKWFSRHGHGSKLKDAHMLFEEFNGVLTGMSIDSAVMERDEYLKLGVKQSIFAQNQRDNVYNFFLRYIDWLRASDLYDPNLLAFDYQSRCEPRYDFVVVDEVQDITNIQLQLILKSLHHPENFVLCGDSNQIVHPNFFSWAKIKTMFHEKRVHGRSEIIRVLNVNYRNSPQVTAVANRLLLVKNARFGSIDRESNYLVTAISDQAGTVELTKDNDKTRREIDKKTSRSTHFAIIVMRSEDKPEAKQHFRTPLIFSVQEAKGLEYENIVLLNFISNNTREFDEIIDGVTQDDLNKELRYARATDKSDKSLEVYKFYTNTLYVALTRAIRNVYLVESHTRHRIWQLLDLAERKGEPTVKAETSTDEEWKEEARKLEMQGKTEQADAIRKTILDTKEVPWRVLTSDSIEDLMKEALNPDHYNKKAKQLLFEYAVIYHIPHIFDALVRLKFKRAATPFKEQNAIESKYLRDYSDPTFVELNRKINQYGIDFRNPLNQTPLMLAAQTGSADLVKSLIKNGAHMKLRDNWGRTPILVALRKAYHSETYAHNFIDRIYNDLAPTSIKVKTEGRMIKIDMKLMDYFMLQSMLALFQDIVRVKTQWDLPAFETGDFVYALQHFSEHVISARRKKRAYLSSILSKNEVNGKNPYNRQLFVRVQRGRYILNPMLEIEVDGEWINVYDLIGISHLEKEEDDKSIEWRRLRAVIQFVRDQQAEAAATSETGREQVLNKAHQLQTFDPIDKFF